MGVNKIINFTYPNVEKPYLYQECHYLIIEGDEGDFRIIDKDFDILLPCSFKTLAEVEAFFDEKAAQLKGYWK